MKYNIPAFLWAVIILIILALPGDKLPELSFWQFIPFFDKWVHFGLFFIFAGLLSFGFIWQTKFSVLNSKTILYVLVISVFYSAFTELMQNFIFLRSADFIDFLADGAGCILGALVNKILLEKVIAKKFRKAI